MNDARKRGPAGNELEDNPELEEETPEQDGLDPDTVETENLEPAVEE